MTFAEVTTPHPTAASWLRQQACVSLSRTGEGSRRLSLPHGRGIVVPGLTRDRWPLGAKSLDPAASDPGLRRDDEYGSIHLTLRTGSVICSSTLQPLTKVARKDRDSAVDGECPFALPKQRGRRGCVSSGGYPHGNACQRRRGRSYDAVCFSPGNLPSQAGSPGRASHRRWRGISPARKGCRFASLTAPFRTIADQVEPSSAADGRRATRKFLRPPKHAPYLTPCRPRGLLLLTVALRPGSPPDGFSVLVIHFHARHPSGSWGIVQQGLALAA